MIADKLKKSILNAAIQGKLTEQLSNDGNAIDLLKEILLERNNQIFVVEKNKSRERDDVLFSELLEDDFPFDIPDNWCWVRIGDIFDVARGGSPRPIQEFITENSDGLNWIKIGDSDIGGKYINETREKIKLEGLKRTRLVNQGDLLLTNSMSYGRPYILNIKGCIHDGWLVLSPYIKSIDKEYMYYLLSSDFIQAEFNKTVSGAVVKNLNSAKVKVIAFPLPPVKEQKRIVARIEKLFNELDELKKDELKLDKLLKEFPRKMKESLLLYAIQGKLTEQLQDDGDAYLELKEIVKNNSMHLKNSEKLNRDLLDILEDDVPFDLPSNWCWTKLGKIGLWSTGATPLKSNVEYYKNGTIPWLRTGDLNNNIITNANEYITELALKKTSVKMFPKGTILLAMYGATIGKIGILDIESTTNQACCGCIVFNGVHNKYLFYYLMSQKKEFINQGVGGAQPNISKEKIVKNLIPLPPLKEQVRIAKILDEMLPLCDSLI